MSPFFATTFPFITGPFEKALLREQLQMQDTIHIPRFQSIKSSEFKTFIFFNYANYTPQIFSIKMRGLFLFSQQFFRWDTQVKQREETILEMHIAQKSGMAHLSLQFMN